MEPVPDARFTTRLEELFPGALPLGQFVERSTAALASLGFTPGETLPLVGVCRDELTHPVVVALRQVWGPAFRLASLGGMLYLGRTGMAAAFGNAPHGSDGRKRFAAFVFPHVAIDTDGDVGRCVRPGQVEQSGACGALIAFQRALASGEVDVRLDWGDVEQALLRQRLLREMTYGAAPDLATLTLHARDAIMADMAALTWQLVRSGPCDVAVFGGVIVHGPATTNFIAPGRSFALLGDEHREVEITLGAGDADPAGTMMQEGDAAS